VVVPAENRPNADFVDRKTWSRIQGAIASIVSKQVRPYMFDESFMALDDRLARHKDKVIGKGFEQINPNDGYLKIFALNAVGKRLAARVDEEDLTAQVIFAREDKSNQFSGDMRLYGFASGEGEIKIRATARITDPDPDLNFENSIAASQVGLSRVWRQLSSHQNGSTEHSVALIADHRTGMDIARALVTLDRQIPARP
jgi:hypothetical protein